MTPSLFEGLLSWIGLKIKKTATPMRDPIGPSERLAVTLRYLVTGDAQVTIAASYRISPSTIGRIIKETCKVLWDVAESKRFPQRPSDRKNSGKKFLMISTIIGTSLMHWVPLTGSTLLYRHLHVLGQNFLTIKKLTASC